MDMRPAATVPMTCPRTKVEKVAQFLYPVVVNVLPSIQAFQERLELLDPHLLLPLEVYQLNPGQLGQILVEELPSQSVGTKEWTAELELCETPEAAAQVVLRWVQHRLQTIAAMEDLEERRLQESPYGVVE